MKKVIFSTFFLLILSRYSAQSQTIHEQAYWLRVVAKVELMDKWLWQTEVENRRFLTNNQELQYIVQTHLHRKWGNYTEGALGFAYSNAWSNGLETPELRPFQELYRYQSLTKTARLSHRLRVEERWLHNASKTELTAGYHFKARLRYRAQVDWKISTLWAVKLNDELMSYSYGFDQNQAYIGLEYTIKKGCAIELGYLNMRQKRSNNAGYLDRDNVRLTLLKNFDLR